MTQLEIMGANAKNASVFLRTAGSKKTMHFWLLQRLCVSTAMKL